MDWARDKMSNVTAEAARAAAAHAQPLVDMASAVAQTATLAGAGAAVTSNALSLPDWAAIVSMTVAVLGFLLQVYLAIRKMRSDRFIRLTEETELAVAADAEQTTMEATANRLLRS